MKKTIVIASCLFVLFACKKSSTTPTPVPTNNEVSSSASFITATIDGKDETFNFSANAVASETAYRLAISGRKDSTTNAHVLSMMIVGYGPVVAGKTYSTTAPAKDSDFIQMMYALPDAVNFKGYVNNDLTNPTNVSVTITAINDSIVQGSFQGPLWLSINHGDSATQMVTITNGLFSVAIRK